MPPDADDLATTPEVGELDELRTFVGGKKTGIAESRYDWYRGAAEYSIEKAIRVINWARIRNTCPEQISGLDS